MERSNTEDGRVIPSLFFDVQEVEETKTGKVNKSGYLYVGRKHKDKEVIWIKLKECKLQPAAFKKWLKMTNNKLDAIEEQNKMMGLCSG